MRVPEPKLITPDDELYEKIMSRMKTKLGVGQPRSGTHVSDLIYCALKGWAKKQLSYLPANVLEEEEDDQVLVWIVGRSHEDIFGEGFVKGEPVVKDGIIGTIDFLDQPDGGGRSVIEAKSTRMSSKKWLDEIPHYIAQAASYCCMHNTNEAKVLIFHIMGDYFHQTKEGKKEKAGPRAHLKIYNVEFEKEELKAWWRELKRRKKILESEEKPDVDEEEELIPVFDWECGFCRVGGLVNCPKYVE